MEGACTTLEFWVEGRNGHCSSGVEQRFRNPLHTESNPSELTVETRTINQTDSWTKESPLVHASIQAAIALAQSILSLAFAEQPIPLELIHRLSEKFSERIQNDSVISLIQKIREGGQYQILYAVRLSEWVLATYKIDKL